MAYTIKKIKFHEEYKIEGLYEEGNPFIKDGKLDIELMADVIIKKLTVEEIRTFIERLYEVYSKYEDIEVEDDDIFQTRIKNIAKDLTSKFQRILNLIDEGKYNRDNFKEDIQGVNISMLVFMFKDYLYREVDEYYIQQDKFLNTIDLQLYDIINEIRLISLYKRYELKIKRYVEDVILLDNGEYIYLKDFKELEDMKNNLNKEEYLILVENFY